MKKISIYLLMFLLFDIVLISHEQITHQYLTIEAYKLLKKEFNQHPEYFEEMDDYIGTLGCDKISTDDDAPFASDKIAGGAWAEDVDDIVFDKGYHITNMELEAIEHILGEDYIKKMFVSSSHFWNPNNGYYNFHSLRLWPQDGEWRKIAANILDGTNFFDYIPTSYYKLRKFLNGFRHVYDKGSCYKSYNAYPGIIQFYNTGQLLNVFDWSNSGLCPLVPLHPPDYEATVTLSLTQRKARAYNILGRIIHLVQDAGVPAHVNLEEHALMEDYFEPAMSADEDWYIVHWDADRVFKERGGFINPFAEDANDEIVGLMTKLAQLTDYMPSRREDGDDDLNTPGYSGNMGEVESILTSYAPESPWTKNQYNNFHDEDSYDDDKMTQEMDVLIPYTIRITAGILYWFMVETGQIPSSPLTKSVPYLELANNTINGNNYLFRATSVFQYVGDPPYDIMGIINVCPQGSQGDFIIDKCARNVTFVAGNKVIINPGFIAKQGSQVHLYTDESSTRVQSPEEVYPFPEFNRKAETDCDCKSNYE